MRPENVHEQFFLEVPMVQLLRFSEPPLPCPRLSSSTQTFGAALRDHCCSFENRAVAVPSGRDVTIKATNIQGPEHIA